MEGYLRKRGTTIRSWKRRWFRLVEGILFYYKNTESRVERGSIPIVVGEYAVKVPPSRYGQPHCFELVTGRRTYALRGSSAENVREWLQALRRFRAARLAHLLSSRGLALSCSIPRHEKVTEGKASWVAYHISCFNKSLSWSILRRYSEFVELDKVLSSAHPVLMRKLGLPQLPPTTALSLSGASEHDVARRRVAFEAYLQRVSSESELVMGIRLLAFLGAARSHTGRGSRDSHVDKLLPALEIGDIVLFSTKSFGGTLTRALTKSSWDHVGLVLRCPLRSVRVASLMLLEASTASGVRMLPLESFLLDAHANKAKLAVRRLEWDIRKHEEHEKIDRALRRLMDFVNSAVAKPYGLLSNLLFRGGSGKGPSGASSDANHDSYFCSQLVAAAYKAMGIIPAAPRAGSFLPSTFAEAGGALTMVGARLGPEIMLRFDKIGVSRAKPRRALAAKLKWMDNEVTTARVDNGARPRLSNSETGSSPKRSGAQPAPSKKHSLQHARRTIGSERSTSTSSGTGSSIINPKLASLLGSDVINSFDSAESNDSKTDAYGRRTSSRPSTRKSCKYAAILGVSPRDVARTPRTRGNIDDSSPASVSPPPRVHWLGSERKVKAREQYWKFDKGVLSQDNVVDDIIDSSQIAAGGGRSGTAIAGESIIAADRKSGLEL